MFIKNPEISADVMNQEQRKTIVEELGPMISSICRRMIRNPETAADAAQETWYQVIKNLPGFRNQSSLSTWIYSVAVRVIGRYAIKEKLYSTRFLHTFFHKEEIVSPYSDSAQTALFAREQCDNCLTGILHCLDTNQRLVYIFRDLAELTWSEIAYIMELTEVHVRQLGSRAKRKLRNFLNRNKAEETFTLLQEVFECTDWTITEKEKGFTATAHKCKLCASAKQLGAGNPCQLFCLSPIEGMVKGLNPHSNFAVQKTLWDGNQCHVEVENL